METRPSGGSTADLSYCFVRGLHSGDAKYARSTRWKQKEAVGVVGEETAHGLFNLGGNVPEEKRTPRTRRDSHRDPDESEHGMLSSDVFRSPLGNGEDRVLIRSEAANKKKKLETSQFKLKQVQAIVETTSVESASSAYPSWARS